MRVSAERLATFSDFDLFWIPIEDSCPSCCNCGVHWDSDTLPCGHAFCSVCLGRDRDEGHAEECATMDKPAPLFKRADHDCHGCGQRHPEWEECAKELWNEHERREADRDTRRPAHLKALKVLRGWSGRGGKFGMEGAAHGALHALVDAAWREEERAFDEQERATPRPEKSADAKGGEDVE